MEPLHVVHIITSLDAGGAEATLYRLCAYGDRAYRHTVISFMDRGVYRERLEAAGAAVRSLQMQRRRLSVSGVVSLFRLIRSLRPAVVQTWMYHADLVGGVAARLAGVRGVVWCIRGPLDRGETPAATMLVARLCARLSRRIPRRIISCSAHAADVHRAIGYAPERIVVIPNGYPLDEFRPDAHAAIALRDQWSVGDGVPVIGMVARFDPYKDHRTLFEALAFLRNSDEHFRCVFVGAGMDDGNPEVRALVKAAGVGAHVKLLGPRDDIPAVMNALDVHVLSSLNEAFPNVIAEAMACGTPCVTTDVGDAKLIVGDAGWVVPRRDPRALAGAIATAISATRRGPERERLRVACRERIKENFDFHRMFAAYARVWDQAGAAGAKSDRATLL